MKNNSAAVPLEPLTKAKKMRLKNRMSKEIIFILLGWFLGLFSSFVVDLNRRQRSSQELKSVLRTELHELQFRLAMTKFNIDTKYSELNRESLEWTHSIVKKYKGINPTDNIERFVSALLEGKEQAIHQFNMIEKNDDDRALMLKKFPTSILEANLANLPYLKATLQNLLSELRFRLNLLNELVDEFRFYYNSTFQEISDGNHNRLRENLAICCKQYSNQCKIIADVIERMAL